MDSTENLNSNLPKSSPNLGRKLQEKQSTENLLQAYVENHGTGSCNRNPQLETWTSKGTKEDRIQILSEQQPENDEKESQETESVWK